MDHQYDPINLGGRTFRLVRLLRGYYDTIRCELFQAWLEECPEYDALSYTWGSTEKSKSIKLDGRDFRVTDNLHAALYELRSGKEDKVFWIDAICIDQSNSSERSHQVEQMPEIYRRSDRVIIWLGAATPETNVIMTAMEQLQMELRNCPRSSWNATDKHLIEAWRATQLTLFKNHGITYSQPYGCMLSLLKRDWFYRVWILQEVANARTISVTCGSKSVSRDVFRLMPDLLGIKAGSHCQAVLNLFTPSWKHEDRDLRKVLMKFWQSKATEPKDKIYALLGMTSDAFQTNFLKVDYKKTLEHVIADTTSFILSLHGLGYQIQEHGSWCTLSKFEDMLYAPLSEMLNWVISHDSQLAKRLGDVGGRTEVSPQNLLLLSASSRGSLGDVAKLVIERNDTDVNVRNEFGHTPLMLAIKNGHEAVARLLIKRGDVKLDIKDHKSRTAMIFAVMGGLAGIIKILLGRSDTIVNSRGSLDQTVPHYAARLGNTEVVKMLLERSDTALNVRNEHGQTPLMLAIEMGHEEIVKMLLDMSDINVNSWDQLNHTALCYAARLGNTAVAEILLQRNDTNVNGTNGHGDTPLLLAIMNGHEVIINMLLDRNDLDVNSVAYAGRLALLNVARLGNTAIIEMLLKRAEVDPNSASFKGVTALHKSTELGYSAVAQSLLRHPNTNPNLGTSSGETPLWIAAYWGRKKIAELLLERSDVDINSRCSRGYTPSLVAKVRRNYAILELLEKADRRRKIEERLCKSITPTAGDDRQTLEG